MAGKKQIVLDTNIFMESIDVLKKLVSENEVVVPLVVLEELDNLKDSNGDRRRHKARHAIKFINKYFDKFLFDEEELEGKPDNQIVQVAEKYNCRLATNDVCVKVKCRSKNIEVISFLGNLQEYKGYRILELDTTVEDDNKVLAAIYSEPTENILDLNVNEYVIIRDISQTKEQENGDVTLKTIDILRWDGNAYLNLKYPPKRIIAPLNDLQACALDLLSNPNIPIKIVAGGHGSGKTMMATMMGAYLVEEKNRYNKLILVRNNDNGLGNSKDIGHLPGTFEDKTDILFQTMIQHLPQKEYQYEKMKAEGRLECHIPYFMKGLSLNGFMIFDESEDASLSEIKTIGSRIEEDGCICLTGDWKQAEGLYKSDSGMVQLIEQTIDNPLVGVIVLDKDVRSCASQVFSELV